MMEEWRYVSVGCGAQCVMMVGTTEMQQWCVDNWVIMDVRLSFPSFPSIVLSLLPCLPASAAVMRHRVLSNGSLFYHLDDVGCNGNEDLLSVCDHGEVGVHNCAVRDEEAGVICSSRFCFMFLLCVFSMTVMVLATLECSENDVRLMDGDTPGDGRVEICIYGLWGSVCDHGWDYRDARVVCRQLGYDGRE